LNRTARYARTTPGLWLDQQDIYGNVGQVPRFRTAFAAALDRLYRDGVPATLAAFTNAS
jgi:mannitol 2-dehydrogenase